MSQVALGGLGVGSALVGTLPVPCFSVIGWTVRVICSVWLGFETYDDSRQGCVRCVGSMTVMVVGGGGRWMGGDGR